MPFAPFVAMHLGSLRGGGRAEPQLGAVERQPGAERQSGAPRQGGACLSGHRHDIRAFEVNVGGTCAISNEKQTICKHKTPSSMFWVLEH